MELQRKLELAELLTEKDYLKKYDIRILILSRSRSESISTHKVLPEYIEILVPTSEEALYRQKVRNPILTIPDEIKGLGKVRNWVLKHFKEETIIMVDDDIRNCYCLTHEFTRKITDGNEVVQILINTAVMAKDIGARVFGFAQTDIRKYNGCDPFNLNTWIGGVIGVIGRKYDFRNDKFKVDVDYCLQNLLVERIVFQNTMYTFPQMRDNNKGGNSAFRTEDDYNKSVQSLSDKWGDSIKIKWHNSQIKISLNVPRRQSLEIF